ncbi:hypothetical protein, partial [Mycolicibacter algericus]|uniref:hypothetical protein n=1 Tax=Mycolicibacter algericus TaxID=1288388 RepID=UPI0021F2EFE4
DKSPPVAVAGWRRRVGRRRDYVKVALGWGGSGQSARCCERAVYGEHDIFTRNIFFPCPSGFCDADGNT